MTELGVFVEMAVMIPAVLVYEGLCWLWRGPKCPKCRGLRKQNSCIAGVFDPCNVCGGRGRVRL